MSDKREWTEEQAELIETGLDGLPRLKRVAVSADAGAGKTSVLVQRVRSLLEAPSAAGKRVLCVSFTERSKADLEEKLSDILSAEVYTIHGFCGRVVAEFGSLLGISPVYRIMDKDETEDLFYSAFEKVYRRSPPTDVDHGMDTFFSLCQKAAAASENAVVHAPGAAEFVGSVLEEFELAKHARGALEYSDLEAKAGELLEKPEVVRALRGRYAHLFVDEFQDTSPLQCALVKALVGNEGLLFVVGDEKQSIYRFRGADVGVFREFVATIPERRRLSANFRSHADVIEAVNQVCTPAIEGYQPMRAGRREKGDATAFAAKGDTSLTSGLPRVARVTSETDGEGIEAVLRAVAARGVPWTDVVVLLRRIRGNEKLFAELSRRGISVAATSASSSSMDDDLDTLLNLWIWACEPQQKLRAARALIDFTEAKQEALIEPSPGAGGAGAGALWGSIGIAPQFGETCETLVQKLEKRFNLSQRFGAKYEQFKLFVLKHQSEGLSPARLARRLQRLAAAEKEVGGFVLLPPPNNLSGSVRAITVHGSKGLEFPVVILADLNSGKPRQGAIISKREREKTLLWLASRGEDGKLEKSSDELKVAIEAERRAEDEESARLLYVAMTRAKEALYVVDRPEEVADDCEKPKRRVKPSLWAQWLRTGITTVVPCEKLLDGGHGPPRDAGRAAANASVTNQSTPIEPNPPAYTRARIGVMELVQMLEDERTTAGAVTSVDRSSDDTVFLGQRQRPAGSELRQPPPSSQATHGPAGQSSLRTGAGAWPQDEVSAQDLGTKIHELLELEDRDGLKKMATRHRIKLDRFWTWLDTPEGQTVFAPNPTHAPADDRKRVECEFAFEWKTQRGVVTGRMDRMVVVPAAQDVANSEPEIWIIDYKVLLHRRSKEDLMASYASQLGLYADAVKILTKSNRVRAFILDIAAATGEVWHEVAQTNR